MRILAVDPGSKESGFVIWDIKKQMLLDYGIVKNQFMLQYFVEKRLLYDKVVIEFFKGIFGKGYVGFPQTAYWVGTVSCTQLTLPTKA